MGSVVGSVLGGLQLGSMISGAKQQKQAAKAAQQAADMQMREIGEQRDKARQEQDGINSRLNASKKKLAVGMARSNRRRSRGGLFGDSAEVNTPAASNVLGG